MALFPLPRIVWEKPKLPNPLIRNPNQTPRREAGEPSILFRWIKVGVLSSLGLGACAPFDVNVGTEEPLKVDLSMEVHVYQHGEANEAEQEARLTHKESMVSRRNRMEEIQELKNNRLVGESRNGVLEIRNLPAGDYGSYVRETVEAENADREYLMKHEAEQKDVPIVDIRRMQWRHWQRKSFPGEWIEIESDDDEGYRWIQKKSATDDAEESGSEESADEEADSEE